MGAAIDIEPPWREAFQLSVGQHKPAKIRLSSEEICYEGRLLARRRFWIALGKLPVQPLVCPNKPIQLPVVDLSSTGLASQEQALTMKYNHVGIPTTAAFDGEIPLPHLKVTVSDHQNNPFGIQWQRYWDGAPYPDLVKTVPHVAFEVEDLAQAIQDQKVIIEPNSPSTGVMVAFIEVNGAPVELMQIDHLVRKDL
jgi:hypothetical protein